jgi:hypothetical protein
MLELKWNVVLNLSEKELASSMERDRAKSDALMMEERGKSRGTRM